MYLCLNKIPFKLNYYLTSHTVYSLKVRYINDCILYNAFNTLYSILKQDICGRNGNITERTDGRFYVFLRHIDVGAMLKMKPLCMHNVTIPCDTDITVNNCANYFKSLQIWQSESPDKTNDVHLSPLFVNDFNKTVYYVGKHQLFLNTSTCINGKAGV